MELSAWWSTARSLRTSTRASAGISGSSFISRSIRSRNRATSSGGSGSAGTSTSAGLRELNSAEPPRVRTAMAEATSPASWPPMPSATAHMVRVTTSESSLVSR